MLKLIEPCTRTVTLEGALADVNEVLDALATDDEAPVELAAEDLAVSDFGKVSRTLTVTTTASATTYNIVDPIVITGTNSNGVVISEEFLLTDAGGDETIAGTKGFRTISSVEIPIQDDDAGAISIGVQNVILADVCRYILVRDGGSLKMSYSDGSTDTIPAIANSELLPLSPVVLHGEDSTAETFTLFF